MGFSAKAKEYFYKELNLQNRDIAKAMDNYSESLVSRYLNQDKISATFILKIKKHFPDSPVNEWMEEVPELFKGSPTTYAINPVKKINRMIKELEELKLYFKEK